MPARVQLRGQVERGLPAERRQERIRPLRSSTAAHALEVERLEVGAVGPARSVMIVAGLELISTVR